MWLTQHLRARACDILCLLLFRQIRIEGWPCGRWGDLCDSVAFVPKADEFEVWTGQWLLSIVYLDLDATLQRRDDRARRAMSTMSSALDAARRCALGVLCLDPLSELGAAFAAGVDTSSEPLIIVAGHEWRGDSRNYKASVHPVSRLGDFITLVERDCPQWWNPNLVFHKVAESDEFLRWNLSDVTQTLVWHLEGFDFLRRRVILLSDLLGVNESALPPQVVGRFRSAIGSDLPHEDLATNHFILLFRYDEDLAASVTRIVQAGGTFDRPNFAGRTPPDIAYRAAYSSGLGPDGEVLFRGPFHRSRFLTVSRVAVETLQSTVVAQRAGDISHFDVDVHESLCEVLESTRQLPGVYLEVGVYLGGSAFTALEYFRRAGLHRMAFLADTFDGFSYKEAKESSDSQWYGSHRDFDNSESWKAHLQALLEPRAVPFKLMQMNVARPSDWEEQLPLLGAQIAMANVDVDLYEATLVSLQQVAPLVVLGGVIILEDVPRSPSCQWCGSEGAVGSVGSAFRICQIRKFRQQIIVSEYW